MRLLSEFKPNVQNDPRYVKCNCRAKGLATFCGPQQAPAHEIMWITQAQYYDSIISWELSNVGKSRSSCVHSNQ